MAVVPQQAQARRGLRLLLASTATSVTGDGMLVSAAPLMAASLSDDPVQVGAVAAASMAAWLLVGIPAGALVDRWDRRRVMIVADLARAAILLVFVALAWLEWASIPVLAVTVFAVGVGTCFFAPASVALLPDVVGKEKEALTTANGRIWSIDTFGRSLAGPPLGAAAFSAGRVLPFAADALSFLLSALFIGLLRVDGKPQAIPRTAARLWPDIKDGARYLFGDRELRDLAAGAGAYNFAFNVVNSTLVLFALQRLGVGIFGFGLLLSVAAVGGVTAGWFAKRLIGDRHALKVFATALLVQGFCWLAIVLFPTIPVSAVSLAILGATSNIITVAGYAVRQAKTPTQLIGRVASMSRLVGSGGAALGAATGGIVAAAYGLTATFWVAGGLLAITSIVALAEASSVVRAQVTSDEL